MENQMTKPSQQASYFGKIVDMRSRQAMIDFLSGHYRYDTANSCNQSTSYAHCVKIHSLGLTNAQDDKAHDYLSADESDWYQRDEIIERFTREQGGRYTIGSNGRSSGYLVLYQSQYKQSEHKSRCRACGQLNFKTVAETNGNKCGRCGAEGERGRADFVKPLMTLDVWPMRGTDMRGDFDPENWSMDTLRSRVRLVQAFDAACDELRLSFIDMLDESEVIEETVTITKTVKVFGAAA
jgi:hypothetical protein